MSFMGEKEFENINEEQILEGDSINAEMINKLKDKIVDITYISEKGDKIANNVKIEIKRTEKDYIKVYKLGENYVGAEVPIKNIKKIVIKD